MQRRRNDPVAWTAIHQSLGGHPKLKRLAEKLGIHKCQAKGHLISLWHWAMDYAPHGDISKFSAKEIEAAAEWDGAPKAFNSAIRHKDSRWVDPDGKLHEWSEHALHYAAFLEKTERVREQTRGRVRAFRERERVRREEDSGDASDGEDGEGNAGVTRYVTLDETLGNAPINSTVHDKQYKSPLTPQRGVAGNGSGQGKSQHQGTDGGSQEALVAEVIDGFKLTFGVDIASEEWDRVYLRGMTKRAKKMLMFFKGDVGKCLDCIEAIDKHAKARRWTDWTANTVIERMGDWATGRLGKN